jgi:hypothetical protein
MFQKDFIKKEGVALVDGMVLLVAGCRKRL